MIPRGLVQQLERCASLGPQDVGGFAIVHTRDARVLVEALELADVLLWMRRRARQRQLTVGHMQRLLMSPRRETLRQMRREARQEKAKCR